MQDYLYCCGKQDCTSQSTIPTCGDGALLEQFNDSAFVCLLEELQSRSDPEEKKGGGRGGGRGRGGGCAECSAASSSFGHPPISLIITTLLLSLFFLTTPTTASSTSPLDPSLTPLATWSCPKTYNTALLTSDGYQDYKGADVTEAWIACCSNTLVVDKWAWHHAQYNQVKCCNANSCGNGERNYLATSVESCADRGILESLLGVEACMFRGVWVENDPPKMLSERSEVMGEKNGSGYGVERPSRCPGCAYIPPKNAGSRIVSPVGTLYLMCTALSAFVMAANTAYGLDADASEQVSPYCPSSFHPAYDDYRPLGVILACCPDTHIWTDTVIIDKEKHRGVLCCRGQYCAIGAEAGGVSAWCDGREANGTKIGGVREGMGFDTFGDGVEMCWFGL